MSAFGGKADITVCGNPLSRSLLGAKRTWLVAAHMSACDPKRTFAAAFLTYPLTRVRNWTEVQLDFSAHNRDNQNDKFRAGSAA